ncbi:GIY-YIG nuclease family protein [uncultured Pelagimonas sp.]|uniref:GIY-YIG nuclease family protein n=1 Tax=uncultured Pelagimonas sp. TaxID=1618102 RepID=UPI0026346B55|nr:GIY-YIG nuclease family protein [uncultured Pelagimonas sp.]
MNKGRSLELYFVDGRPDGMLTAEVFNWTGHVLRIPKIRLPDGLRRPEAKQTGVYVLLGQDETGALAYIGEAENMADRLRQHASQKEWWDEAVLVTTAGDGLHKAHVKYLESRLVEIAKDAGVMRLENGNIPPKASLNEAATANMESFLDTLHMVLPAIRVDMFQTRTRQNLILDASKSIGQNDNPTTFYFTVKRNDLSASAVVAGDEFILQKGSRVRSQWAGDRKQNTHYWKLHDELVAKGTIRLTNGQAILAENVAFSSPSAAAAIVAGRSSNGRTSWKTQGGKTYAEWEEEQLEKVDE